MWPPVLAPSNHSTSQGLECIARPAAICRERTILARSLPPALWRPGHAARGCGLVGSEAHEDCAARTSIAAPEPARQLASRCTKAGCSIWAISTRIKPTTTLAHRRRRRCYGSRSSPDGQISAEDLKLGTTLLDRRNLLSGQNDPDYPRCCGE
jgi:hypothetical protein